MLEKLAENLWTYKTDFRVPGLNLGGRMTIIRLHEGGLFLHSPAKLTPELSKVLMTIGNVKYIIAPNSYHHLFVGPYLQQFAQAEFWTVPQVVAKRPDLAHADIHLLPTAAAAFVGGEIMLEVVHGRAGFSEGVFLHTPSKTLIVSDLLFNLPDKGLGGFIAKYIVGGASPPRVSRFGRFAIGRESPARVSIHKIINWDFDRIILAHGEVIDHEGPAIMKEAFNYLVV